MVVARLLRHILIEQASGLFLSTTDCVSRGFLRRCPAWGLGNLILKIGCDRRPVPLQAASLWIGDHNGGVVDELWANLLLDAEEAPSEPVKESAEVVSLVDLALTAARLAMGYKGSARLVVLETVWAVHFCDTMVIQNMTVKVGGYIVVLSLVNVSRHISFSIRSTHSQTKGQ